jgi:hypothetical protein
MDAVNKLTKKKEILLEEYGMRKSRACMQIRPFSRTLLCC